MDPRTLVAALLTVGLVATGVGSAEAKQAAKIRYAPKTLRVSTANPRYFTNASGRAIYLTGSHVWWNLVGGPTWKANCELGRAAPYDYLAHLDRLRRYGHNFIRMWRIELTHWRECSQDVRIGLHPWVRTGSREARDGRPRFDLRRFDPAYFRRLRSRVVAARKRGFYVSVMLFEGWSAQFADRPWRATGHPFHPDNNVNGLDPDVNRDGMLAEVYTLRNAKIRRLQEAYVRRVADTVGDLDNVLYEIANESGAFSVRWQYHMIRYLRRYEAGKGRRHPIGMTYVHGDLTGATLRRSPADWISPADHRHLNDPPPASPGKVVISDTDHHCGGCGDGTFPWRVFMRGYSSIFMDEGTTEPRAEEIRKAMGNTRRYAARIDLVRMAPRGDLCSTYLCLVNPGREYLVYAPHGGTIGVDLRAGAGRRFTVEWMRAIQGTRVRGTSVAGGANLSLRPPFGGPAVVYLKAN